jgi:hypothetical protein
MDMYTSGLIALQPCGDVDLVQGRQLLQQPCPCRLVKAQGGVDRWRGDEVGGGRIGAQLPQQGPLHIQGQVRPINALKPRGVAHPSVLPHRGGHMTGEG